jgi:hypothetical protein
VHSSTSSSKSTGRWGTTAVIFVAASALFLGGGEIVARKYGRHPVLKQNDLRLWAEVRGGLDSLGPQGVVFLGASRIARGLSGPELERQLGNGGYLQLGVDGCLPGGAIEDILNQESFNGVVVASIFVKEAKIDDTVNPWLPCQQKYVDFFNNRWDPVNRAEWYFQRRLKLTFSLLSYSHWDLLPFLQGRGVHQPARHSRPDRANPMDFDLPYWQALAEGRAKKNQAQMTALAATIDSPQLFDKMLSKGQKFESLIERFEARGGRFVYLRMPTSSATHPGVYAQLKTRFWDKLDTRAETIHFLDIEAMKDLQTPDGSHLHVKDTAGFTSVLLGELRVRGLLKPR